MPTYVHMPLSQERQLFDEVRARQQRYQQTRTQMNAGLAQRMIQLTQNWPDLPPGAVQGLAMAGVDPLSPAMERIAEQAVLAKHQTGLGFNEPGQVTHSSELDVTSETEKSLVGRATAPLKGFTRTAFAAMEGLYQELWYRLAVPAGVAAARDDMDFGEARERARPSIFTEALEHRREQGTLGLGEGFLPGGPVMEAVEEGKHDLQLDGTFVTPGRLVARTITEPGTKPYQVLSGLTDAAIRLFGDPATYATFGVAKVNAARKTFSSGSGLINGLRKTTDQQFAQHWLTGTGTGKKLTDWLVGQNDPYEIWTTLGKKVPHSVATELADAKNAQAVQATLLPRLGTDILQRPVGGPLSRTVGQLLPDSGQAAIGGLGIHVRRLADDHARWAQWMPQGDALDPQDMSLTIENLDRYMKGAKFGRAERTEVMQKAMRLTEGDRAGLFRVASEVMDRTYAKIVHEFGGDPDHAKRITRMFGKTYEDMRTYSVGQSGRHLPARETQKLIFEGEPVDWAHKPMLATEFINRKIPLPPQKEIRRQIGSYAKAMNTLESVWQPLGMTRSAFQGVADLMASVTTNFWKPLVLLRGAYVTRIGLEEQARMAAAGMDSAFSHPISYIATAAGRKKSLDVKGMDFKEAEEWLGVLQRKGGGHINGVPGYTYTGSYVPLRRGEVPDAEYVSAWASDLGFLVNDNVASSIARMGPREAKDYLWSGAGQKFRKELAEAEHLSPLLRDKDALDSYVDDVWERILDRTGGDADLINAIGTGKLDGQVIRGLMAGEDGKRILVGRKSLRKSLQARLASAPEQVKAPLLIKQRGNRQGVDELAGQYRRAVDTAADWIMSKPTNALARSQSWKQFYWRDMQELVGFADGPTQQRILEGARKAKLSKDEIAAIEARIAKGAGTRITDLDSADLIAKARATDRTKKLLYELTEQGQFTDMMRAVFPFAEAWKEIGVAWGRLLKENPKVMRRAQIAIEGARGNGWFQQDPSTGEEMFMYPGGKLISRFLLSEGSLRERVAAMGQEQEAEFDLGGTVAGLNLFAGSVIPGVGPVVGLAVKDLIPDKPQWDEVREIVFPFGEPDTERGVIQSVFPAWMKKWHTYAFGDPDSDRLYANTVFDVAKALTANGQYSTNSREDVEALMAAAKDKAKSLYLVRSMAQFVAPTGPSVNFRAQDVEGEWWPFQVAAAEFSRLQREHGQEAAFAEFFDRFGESMHLLVQSKSRELIHRPADKVGNDWMRDNPEIVNEYPLTAGLIAPVDESGEFDFEAYVRSFKEGTREQLTPQQMAMLSNATLGRLAYDNVRLQIEAMNLDRHAQRQILATARGQIAAQYPGFDSSLGLKQKPRLEEQIAEIERMAADPKMANHDAVKGIQRYLQARAFAQRAVEATARSTTYGSSQETEPIRRFLRDTAASIAEDHPEFLSVWERVFKREMADDEDPVEPGALAGAA